MEGGYRVPFIETKAMKEVHVKSGTIMILAGVGAYFNVGSINLFSQCHQRKALEVRHFNIGDAPQTK